MISPQDKIVHQIPTAEPRLDLELKKLQHNMKQLTLKIEDIRKQKNTPKIIKVTRLIAHTEEEMLIKQLIEQVTVMPLIAGIVIIYFLFFCR